MKLEERLSLDRLVVFSVAICWLLPLVLLAAMPCFVPAHRSQSTAKVAVLVLGGLVGVLLVVLVLSSQARRAIRRGLMDERWSEAEQEKARAWLESKLLTRATNLLLFGTFALAVGSVVFFSFRVHGHEPPLWGLYYFGIAPSMARNEVLRMFKPAVTPKAPYALQDLKPIQSSHWGRSQAAPPTSTQATA